MVGLAQGEQKVASQLVRQHVARLDLCACEVDRAGAAALASALEFNQALTALRVAYNPLIDDDGKAALRTAAAKWRPALSLVLS